MKARLSPVLLLVPFPVLAAQVSDLTLSAGITLDDNITRAEQDKDIQSDTILSGAARGTYRLPVNSISNLQFTGRFEHQEYRDYDRLSRNNFNLVARYNIQTQYRFTSPWYYIAVNIGMQDVDVDSRDANLLEWQLGMGKRLTDRIKFMASFVSQEHNADTDIFDTRSSRFSVNMDWRTHHNNLVYTTLGYTDGDVVVTTVYPYPSNLDYYQVTHINDSASFPGLVNPWTYKLNATTRSLVIGDNYAIAGHQSLDISLLMYASDADYGFKYDGRIIQLNYFYQF